MSNVVKLAICNVAVTKYSNINSFVMLDINIYRIKELRFGD